MVRFRSAATEDYAAAKRFETKRPIGQELAADSFREVVLGLGFSFADTFEKHRANP